jgi:hypothetical protein
MYYRAWRGQFLASSVVGLVLLSSAESSQLVLLSSAESSQLTPHNQPLFFCLLRASSVRYLLFVLDSTCTNGPSPSQWPSIHSYSCMFVSNSQFFPSSYLTKHIPTIQMLTILFVLTTLDELLKICSTSVVSSVRLMWPIIFKRLALMWLTMSTSSYRVYKSWLRLIRHWPLLYIAP